MADIQLHRIKSIYGEMAGILSQLPLPEKKPWVYVSVGRQFNSAVEDLNKLTDSDYTRQKLSDNDYYMGDSNCYDTTMIRTKIGSVVKRLEEEYGFGLNTTPQSPPVVVTVNQNQEVTIAITPIQQLIDSTEDEELRKDLDELKTAVEVSKDQSKASTILNSIQKKSWEVFIKVLPYVLEHLGQHH